MKPTALNRKLARLAAVLAIAFPVAAASTVAATGQTPPTPPVLQLALVPLVDRVRRLRLATKVRMVRTMRLLGTVRRRRPGAHWSGVARRTPPRDCLARGPPCAAHYLPAEGRPRGRPSVVVGRTADEPRGQRATGEGTSRAAFAISSATAPGCET